MSANTETEITVSQPCPQLQNTKPGCDDLNVISCQVVGVVSTKGIPSY
jgi:hypothetical protein